VEFVGSESYWARKWTLPLLEAEERVDYGVRELSLTHDLIDPVMNTAELSFENVPIALASRRLVGCTSIIVVSRRGVWMNHIREVNHFAPEQRWLPDDPEFELDEY
jgi:hypothetical protein